MKITVCRVELQKKVREDFIIMEKAPTLSLGALRIYANQPVPYDLLHVCENFADGSFAALENYSVQRGGRERC